MILYYASGTCSLASHIALECTGEPFETRRVDFRTSEQRGDDYLSINPKGRVPALITDRGILTETPAILAYIAQVYPAANLAPVDDPFLFARMQSFNSYLCATVHVAHAHGPRGSRWTDDEAAIAAMKRHVPQSMSECFNLIEKSMLEGPWVLGEHFSTSDLYLYTLATWLEGDGVDTSNLPRVMAHRERLAEHPAVRRALATEAA